MAEPLIGGSGKRLGHLVVILAGVGALIASLMTAVNVLIQSKNYRKPLLQRYVVRIMVIIPIYCAASWISLISLKIAFWVDPWRDVYEAFTIYAFFQLLINFLGGERSLIIHMHGRAPIEHIWPMNYCLAKVDISDPHTFLAIKRGILQYVWVRPLLALATVIMKATGTFQEGYIGVASGYFWSGLIYNISIFTALYALALFWMCMSQDLQPFRPMPKFICIKGIIFASWWQGFFLSILVFLGAIPDVAGYTPDNLATAIQNAAICFEMPFFAILHLYAFNPKDYADVTISAARMPVTYALRDAFGTVDLIQDAKDTFSRSKYEYRQFDAGDSTLAHEDSAQRLARIREGMRYERNGKGKYWIPDPHEANSKTPLLGKLTGDLEVPRSRSTSRSGKSGGYGATPNGGNDDISLDQDDENLYDSARGLEFGDWHKQYPVITAHHASREDRLYANPNVVTASTNRHLLQATTENKRRRKSAIRDIQQKAEKGKHRPSASSAEDESGNDDAESSQRGRSKISRIPVVGHAIEKVEEAVEDAVHTVKEHLPNTSKPHDDSQLVDLVIEDKQAEAVERVRARKEGSPSWNRHEAKHFVTAYPVDDPKVEDVRAGFEPDQFDEHGNRHPAHQHKMDEDFAIGSEEEEEQEERAQGETKDQWNHRSYGKDVPYRDEDEGGPGELEEEQEGRRKHDHAEYAVEEKDDEENRDERNGDKGKGVSYGDEEENVWASPRR